MKIALVNAHYTYILGGSEIQCHQIAQGLTELGIDLTYLAVGGYDTSKHFDYQLLSVDKNAQSIIQACKELKPDIIYWRFNKNLLASVIGEVKVLNIKLVFSVSHIHDLEPFAYKPIPNLGVLSRTKRRLAHLIKGIQFQKAFKKVDGVICNNEEHLMLISHSNKVYIPNSPFLEYDEFTWPRPYVVWVGNIKAHKHPELYIKLAEESQGLGIDFLMVGSIQQEAYMYFNTSNKLPRNFYFLGPKDILETNGIISESLFLTHTCEPEGFPNVFLQAWGMNKPVISLFFDPGETIYKSGAGKCSGDFQQFKIDVKELLSNESLREEMGGKGKVYLNEHFNSNNNLKLLEKFLLSTINKGR